MFGNPSDFSTGTDTTLIKGDAIWATGSCNENTVSNNVFWRVKGDAIHLIGTATWTIQRWTIKNNGIEWAGYFFPDDNKYGVRIEGNSQRMTVRENYFEGNGSGNTSPSGGAIYCNNTALDIGITENLFANQTYDINLNSIFNAHIRIIRLFQALGCSISACLQSVPWAGRLVKCVLDIIQISTMR